MKASFWNKYSYVYDILNQLSPYQKHLNLLCSSLAPKAGKMYLDAGCGTGNLSLNIFARGAKVIGADYSSVMLDRARAKNKNIQFELIDLNTRLVFSDNVFDGVISNNVIAFLENPQNTLTEFYRVLKPGGKFVIATLRVNFSPLTVYREHLKDRGALHALKIIFPLLGLGICNTTILRRIKTGEYHTYDEKGFSSLLEQCGFTNIKILFSYANQDIVAIGEK